MLSEQTEMCLQEDAFLVASKESVRELLKPDQLLISSEKRLIDYCYKWAQNTDNER
jgi:BTB And C-terminal Kelch